MPDRKTEDFNCAKCGFKEKLCRSEEGKGPPWCPTETMERVRTAAMRKYGDPKVREFARLASVQEGACYAARDAVPFVLTPVKSRLEELIEFSRRLGFKRLGIAFCGGMMHEAALLADLLERQGFEVISVSCKVGRVPKEAIGVRDDEKIRIGCFESMCNPITQALMLNEAETDFNILLGLCIGHDSLFLKYAGGMTTVFAVKDRVTGHNPLAPLYTSRSYYQRLKGDGGPRRKGKSNRALS
jgi:uncharacterized metal-binding protein